MIKRVMNSLFSANITKWKGVYKLKTDISFSFDVWGNDEIAVLQQIASGNSVVLLQILTETCKLWRWRQSYEGATWTWIVMKSTSNYGNYLLPFSPICRYSQSCILISTMENKLISYLYEVAWPQRNLQTITLFSRLLFISFNCCFTMVGRRNK